MSPHILIVGGPQDLRSWMRHHAEILYPDGTVEELESLASPSGAPLERPDVLVLANRCGDGPSAGTGKPDPAPEALVGLRRARSLLRGCPVVLVDGEELSGAQALGLEAVEYLPRSLLSASRLAAALRVAVRMARRQGAYRRALQRRAVDPAHLSLPGYSIRYRLGESARAVVYLAQSTALRHPVALKISRPTIEPGERSGIFERECAAIRAVQHPAVVQIYDYGTHGGTDYLAMEYFPCGDLKMRLQQPLSTLESLEYTQRICGALQAVHGAGLLHRDLKPPNVMLREDRSIVLIDFGLAKHVDSPTRSTAVGVLRGSPYYMSPEQGQGLELDQRSDLYSTGVILFEMLSGTKPYQGHSAIEVIQQHVQGPRPRLPARSAWLEPLLEGFMARERTERFPDAAAACEALQQAAGTLRDRAA